MAENDKLPTDDQLFDQAVTQLSGTESELTPDKLGTGTTVGTPISEEDASKAAAVAERAKIEADAAKTKGAGAEVDPLAGLGLTEAQITAVNKIREEAAAKVKEATETAKRHQSQVAGYEKKLNEAKALAAAAATAGNAAAQARAQASAAEATKSLAKLKEEGFPTIADAIKVAVEEATNSIRRELGQQVSSEIAKVKESVTPLVASHVEDLEAREAAEIEAVHKGWIETLQTPEWKGWWTKQPPGVQKLAQGGAPDEIRLFDLFRKDHPLAAGEQEQQQKTQQQDATSTASAELSAADKLAAKRAQQARDAAGPSGKRNQSPGTDANPDNATTLFDQAIKAVAKEFHVA